MSNALGNGLAPLVDFVRVHFTIRYPLHRPAFDRGQTDRHPERRYALGSPLATLGVYIGHYCVASSATRFCGSALGNVSPEAA